MQLNFIDHQLFSRGEIVRLLGIDSGALEGYVQRGVFAPQFSQPCGGARIRRTYTARDIIKLDVIGSLSRMGLAPSRIRWAIEDGGRVDEAIDRALGKPTKNTDDGFPELRAREIGGAMHDAEVHIYLVFNPDCLVAKWARRLTKYLQLRDRGADIQECMLGTLDGPTADSSMANRPLVMGRA